MAETTNSSSVYESPLELEIPTFKSLFIEIFRGDLKLGTATGFLAANDRLSHCAFITNRHVVTGRHHDSGQPLHSQGALPDAVVIHFHKNQSIGEWVPIRLPLYKEDGAAWWIEHPRLGAKADIVALNIRWGNDVSRVPYYMKNDLDRVSIFVGPAETVSVIGFPFGLSSAERFPIWATGFVAQELGLMTPQNPSFLIDCRARAGQSGSAVIAYRPAGYRKREGNRIVSTLSGNIVWEFLGAYSGRINSESDLGRVWHVTAIEELLDAAEAAMPQSIAP
ncbi:MAG TPA: hypothetical protein VG387_14050 [Rhizomicrobium sp.]|jgi:hypothetical protein|nr:hypothetical protein [Rhizomicrobium sp.]